MQPGTGTMDDRQGTRLLRLTAWEMRRASGRRGSLFRVSLVLLVAVAGVVAWIGAGLPNSAAVALVTKAVSALLLLAPLERESTSLPRLTFALAALRLAAWQLALLARLLAPTLGAETLAGDRQSGRLEELQLVPFSPAEIYWSKVTATLAPLLSASGILLVPLSLVALAEYVPFSEMAAVWAELAAQLLLAGCVTVTLSGLLRSPWAAQAVAHLSFWVMLPLCSMGLLLLCEPQLPQSLTGTEPLRDLFLPDNLGTQQAVFMLGMGTVWAGFGVLSAHPQGVRRGLAEWRRHVRDYGWARIARKGGT